LEGRTLFLPNWDPLTVPILAAALGGAGVDARALEEDELTILEGARFNSGQCLPINAIVQSLVGHVRRHHLDPARTLLWIMEADWACNLHLFPHYMKSLLERYGQGMEKIGVYVGDLSHTEIAPRLAVDAYFAYMFGGLLRRLGCCIRPYETNPGQTDRTIDAAQAVLIDSFRRNRSREDALAEVIQMFSAIPRSEGQRPKVAIFGDFYVRDNAIMNQDLVRFIEAHGGEVVTTPFSEYLRITAAALFKRWKQEHNYLRLAKYRGLLVLIKMLERKFFTHYSELTELTGPVGQFRDPNPEQTLDHYNVRLQQHGESWDNLLKISHLVKVHPDLRLFVQTNPVFCCPSLVTEAMARRIEELTGVPVVTLTYDGTGSFKNDKIVPYLATLQVITLQEREAVTVPTEPGNLRASR
jgi:predicted nucleotide-binding protein (sugar kinase/HSP70/actin superfamily)